MELSKNPESVVLLDTSYSKTAPKPIFITFIRREFIKNNHKKKNIDAYNIYEEEVLKRIDNKTLNQLYCEYHQVPEIDYNLQQYPLHLYDQYEKTKIEVKNRSLLWFAEKTFLNWYNKAKAHSTYIYIKKGDKKSLKKQICRFDKKYADKIIKRMNWMMYKYGNEKCVMITLTLNPSNFNNDKKAMWESITSLIKEFNDGIRKYYNRKKKPMPKYIRCIEAQKNGNPHAHICLFGTKYVPKKVIDHYWPYGFNFIGTTANYEKVRYPIHYVTKYITKTYTDNDADNTLNQSLVWFFNKHSIEHSQDLFRPLYKKGDGSWTCEYIVSMSPLNNELEEMSFIFDTEENFYKIGRKNGV